MNSQVIRLALQAGSKTVSKRALSTAPYFTLSPDLKAQIHPTIGNREIVGHGITGDGIYEDHMAFPASAIRFKEPTEENAIIRQKEKGDWKALSMTEKKELYRYSFCQTYAEMDADTNTGEWKADVGNAFACLGLCALGLIWIKYFFAPPDDFKRDPVFRSWIQRRMIDEYYNPIFGVSHDWDYEQLCWKEDLKWYQIAKIY